MIDRSRQLWLSKIGMYCYVFRSSDGVWHDGSPCAWHEYIDLAKGSLGRAREKYEGSWDKRLDWSRLV